MGPVTATILGCLLLAIIVSLVIMAGRKFGFLDETLASAIIWGTVILIGLILLLLALRLLGVNLGAHLP
jgi:hypothetical protein